MTAMSGFVRLIPPGWGESARTPAAVLDSIDAWARSEPLAALVSAFDGVLPDMETNLQLDWLERFSAQHWDFRAGQERNLARTAEFDPATTRLILDVAEALGLTRSVPPARKSYTHVVILGGLVRACLLRPQYAADLVRGGLRAGSVTALSAYRSLRGDETDLIEALGLAGRSNEMEVMEAGLVRSFGLGDPVDVQVTEMAEAEFGSAMVRTWLFDSLSVRLVVAPSPEPQIRRANTADTYAYWADTCVHLGAEDTVLLVTSSIYLPYQHADAVRMLALPHGCYVETVGIDFSDERLGALRQAFTPANYLQEIRSAIRGIQSLYAFATTMI
jgi:hypothetical protein